MNNNKPHGSKLKYGWVIILIVVLAGGIFAGYKWHSIKKIVNREVIYEGIFIQNIDVGGMSKTEAKNALTDYFNTDNKNRKIVLKYKDKNWVLTYEDWGYKADYSKLINEAYDVGRSGSTFDRYKIISKLQNDNKKYELKYSYDESKIDEVLNNIKKNFSKETKNAIIQRINNNFVVSSGKVGLELDIPNSKKKIKQKLDVREQGTVELVVKEHKPPITKEKLNNVKDLLGEFTTKFNPDGTGRQFNLELAAKKMNSALVMPQEVFSVMKTIGPVDAAHGYKDAPIIVNGKLVPGVGGGICQIATTIYNSVLLSELEVVERQNHSRPVGYITLGRDATLNGNTVDFKFKNSTKDPIYIESTCVNGVLTVKIYGKEARSKTRRVDFEHAVIQTIMPPPSKVINDSTIASGKRVVTDQPKKGYKVKLFKKIYDNDKLVKTEVVNFSYYTPKAGEIHVGTK